MSITQADLDFLTSARGQLLLEDLAREDLSESRVLPLLMRLRREYSPEQARAGLETARLRNKAVEKFGASAHRMFFTREALEQASHPLVRHYRARSGAGLRIIDACCGIGADSLALAAAGGHVLGVDADEVRVQIARFNAQALDVQAQFVTADVRSSLPQADLIFFDPARRAADGRRIFDVESYEPPLSTLRSWDAPWIVVKLSPGVDLDQLKNYDGSVEFISVNGELKEAVLRVGFPAQGLAATLLTGSEILHWSPVGDEPPPCSPPRAWLLEPDPALLRAGFVGDAAWVFAARLLDETIAYLTADTRPDSPWVRAWKILDWMPFQLKRLRAYLRERHVGQVTIKKRGFPMTPEEMLAALKLKGSETRTLVLTRCQGQPAVLICEDFRSE